MSDVFGFSTANDLKRALDAIRYVENLAEVSIVPQRVGPSQKLLLAEVTAIHTDDETGEYLIKAKEKQLQQASDYKQEIVDDTTDPTTWDTELFPGEGIAKSIRLMPGQALPAVGTLIKPYLDYYAINSALAEGDAKVREEDWFFVPFLDGAFQYVAVVTGFVEEGVTANIFFLNDPDLGSDPLVSNVTIPLSHAGSPVFIEVGESFTVTLAGGEYRPLGFLTI